MKIWHLILQEVVHRRGNFALGLLSVTVAIAALVGSMILLESHERETVRILAEKEQQVDGFVADKEAAVKAAGKELENAARKITKGLGFNILILPEQQDLNELHTEGTLSKTLQESKATELAESKIVTVNHLLPLVMKKVQWEEQNGQTIILTGTRGEIPFLHRDFKKPLRDQVPAGEMEVGYLVHQQLKLKQGQEVQLKGKPFKITKLHPEQGSIDDSRVWVNLAEAQEMLGMENLVHAILALECNCATQDRIGEIRAELSTMLPGTQIIERGTTALARAETRNKAKLAAVEALQREKNSGAELLVQEQNHRNELKSQNEKFAAIFIPLILLASAIWIGLLTWINVRQRQSEIGILRAIGLRSRQILMLFLGRAVIMGVAGSVLGCGAGLWLGSSASGFSVEALNLKTLFLLSLLLAPTLALIASWLPAVIAASQDPATVLQVDL